MHSMVGNNFRIIEKIMQQYNMQQRLREDLLFSDLSVNIDSDMRKFPSVK